MRTAPTTSLHNSRAYWELRAEQVMDRVFRPLDGERLESIEVEVKEAPQPAPPWRWLFGGLTALALISAGLLGLGWSRTSQDLRQERTLRLLQGLRELRELRSEGDHSSSTPQRASTSPGPEAEQAPPPPPSEPWMEQLSTLHDSGSGAAPLHVPVNGPLPASATALASPPPLPPLPSGGGAETPELVGVVQSSGRGGSAIFRLNGSFSNANTGEHIGASGWRLLSTNGDSALIERSGISRRVSIGSGL